MGDLLCLWHASKWAVKCHWDKTHHQQCVAVAANGNKSATVAMVILKQTRFTANHRAAMHNRLAWNAMQCCSVHENNRTCRPFPIARPKCLMRDFTNLNKIDKPIGQMSDEPWKFFVNTGADMEYNKQQQPGPRAYPQPMRDIVTK